MTYSIYKITNTINDKVYVGIAGSLNDRWRQHKRQGKTLPYSTWPLYRDINGLGVEHFSIHLIEEWQDDATLIAREQYWIECLNSAYPDGYNIDSRSLKKHRQREGITWEQQRAMIYTSV